MMHVCKSFGVVVLLVGLLSAPAKAETWAQAVDRAAANDAAADAQEVLMDAKEVTAAIDKTAAHAVDTSGANWTSCESNNYSANLLSGDSSWTSAEDSEGQGHEDESQAGSARIAAYVVYIVDQSEGTAIMGAAADQFNSAVILYRNAKTSYGRASFSYRGLCLDICVPAFETEGCDLAGTPNCECMGGEE